MNPFFFKTGDPTSSQNESLLIFIKEHLQFGFECELLGNNEAEIVGSDGVRFFVYASYDSNAFSHKIDFVRIEG